MLTLTRYQYIRISGVFSIILPGQRILFVIPRTSFNRGSTVNRSENFGEDYMAQRFRYPNILQFLEASILQCNTQNAEKLISSAGFECSL